MNQTRAERRSPDPCRVSDKAFTLIELLVVIAIIALLIGILLPALGKARESGRKLQSSSNQRQVVTAMTTFAQDKKSFFPGVDRAASTGNDAFTDASEIRDWDTGGSQAGHFIPARYILMLQDDYLTSEILVSPAEPTDLMPDHDLTNEVRPPQNDPAWIDYAEGGWEFSANGLRYPFNANTVFYSYGMLDLHNTPQGRPLRHVFGPLIRAWSPENMSSDSPVVADRLIFWSSDKETAHDIAASSEDNAGMQTARQSLWTPFKDGGWTGHIAFSDGHVEWSRTSILKKTSYAGIYNVGDNPATGVSTGSIDRSGDDIFRLDTGNSPQTSDCGIVVRSGSQTYRLGGGGGRP
ncbi:MAG: prepilin-type N-terminal cleavage/methylation domain-containing protein [Planctomycetota bacterium]